MAYVNVAEWKPEQVTEWLKGLDNAVLSYIHSFLNNEVSGQQLLNLRPDDLDHLGVHKLGHQELILEAVEHLRNFHYELDRENLQLLALRLSCRAHSLHNELVKQTDSIVSTQTLADVANVITAVKPLVCWLDRSPFTGQLDYQDRKTELLRLSLAIATCAQRDRFAERPVEEIRTSCAELARLADSIIQDIVDPLILQPASLDLATLKKRAGDDLGFFILPSFHGVHQIGEIKFSSPAHQCGKIEEGDEVVQVNYQTVVGWQTKKVMHLFEESPTDVFLTLKKRPRHTKVYGQIYMKPYRLPSRKRAAPYSRWHDNLPSPRPELLTIPDFEMPLPRVTPKQLTPAPVLECEPLASNSSSDDDDDSFLPGVQDEGQTSPTSMRLYLPKPRVTVQRRATVTGASPTNKRPPVNIEQFWRELRLERQWKDSGVEGRKEELYQLRDKSASFGNDLSVSPPPRPTTCLGIEKNCGRLKKLRIIETCDEVPAGSMDSVKEIQEKEVIEKNSKPASDNTSSDSKSSSQDTHSSQDGHVEKHVSQTTGTQEETLRVKGGGYSSPTEDSLEDLEKEPNVPEPAAVVQKERGRLDKSYSTPAYDISENDRPLKSQEWSTSRISECSPLPSPSEDTSQTAFNLEKRTQVAETIDGNTPLESSETTRETCTTSENLDVSLEGDAFSLEDKHTQRIGEILQTINIALLQHRLNNTLPNKGSKSATDHVDSEIQKTNKEETSVTQVWISNPSVSSIPDDINLETENVPGSYREPGLPQTAQICPLPLQRGLQKVPQRSCDGDMLPVKICITPPEPPPRPPATLEHPKSAGGMGYRAIMAARSLGRNTGSKISLGGHATFPSPRSLRKRNPLLAKKRNVSVKDLDVGDCEGWLLHRCRSSGAGAVWLKAWFILKGTVFYGFKTPQSTKADIMICLPGFTVSLAEEVKSRKFSFKVYHTGTVFYFAAETEEGLNKWLECMIQATLKQDFSKPGHESDAVFFSETDEESETDAQMETCFPSPKMRKFAGFLSSSTGSSQQEKPSSRSQQNLTTETKSQDTQKKFGSLRKLGRKANDPTPASSTNQEMASSSSSSLDRKYLRFLGGSRNNIVPVPTAQFRSYRRVPNGPAPAPVQKQVVKPVSESSEQRTEQTQDPGSQKTSETLSQSTMNFPSVDTIEREARPTRIFKPLAHHAQRLREHQIHSSNPSLQLSSDMSDYRLAAERLREFGIRRNRQREDTSGFVTLEEFMLSRQEEERRQNRAIHRLQHTTTTAATITTTTNTEVYTGYSEDPLAATETSGYSRNGSWSSNKTKNAPPVTRRGSFNGSRLRRNNSNELSQDSRSGGYRGGSPEKLWINSLRRNDDTSKKPSQSSQNGTWSTNRLKTAAQYQPPPTSRNNGSSDETPRMKLAFEMHLGENKTSPTETHHFKSSKLRNLFSSSKSHQQQQKPNFLELPPQQQQQQQKTILGSPRLHRAIFREKKHHGSKSSTSESSSSSISSPVSPPTQAAPCDWTPDEYGSQSDPSMAQFKPTMGISMIGKKPTRRILNSSPSPASPPPDYPGLEYPPVFEPETYTLSDASSLLRSRQQANSKRSTSRN